MRELQPLIQGPPYRDEAILAGLKKLEDISERSTQEVRKAVMDLDAVLSPVQRVRFRQFEERLELRKLELLNIARGRGRGPAPAPANPGRGGPR
jgi:hypothetical protein